MYCAELTKDGDKRFGCSLSNEYGRIFVISASGPAEDAGARAGDELLGVNGEYFRKGTTLDSVVAMLAEASRVTLVLRRGPSSTGASLLGNPRPALEWARAEWKPAEAKTPARAAQPVERAPKQEEAKAKAAETQWRSIVRRVAAHTTHAKDEEEERRSAERAALKNARAVAEAERAALAAERAVGRGVCSGGGGHGGRDLGPGY